MVDTGQTWIGRIPQDWSLVRLGSVFRERKTTVSDDEFEPLSVSMSGVVPRMDNVALTANNDARKLVRAGDYVINSRSDRKGSGGLADRDGSVSVISTVITPQGIDPKFAHHLLRSAAFQEEFYRWGSGIVADLWSTRYPAMSRIVLPFPPLPEQRAIANFLDREIAKIDVLIAKQSEMIDLLRERRSATIDGAVRSFPLIPLKRLIDPARPLTYGILQTGPSVDGGIPYIGPSDIPGEGIPPRRADLRTTTPEIAAAYHRSTLRGGDVVISIGPAYGHVMIVSRELEGANLTQDTARIACIPSRAEARYVVRALGSRGAWDFWDKQIAGATFRRLNLGTLGQTPIPLPELDMQRQIADHLDRETTKIDALIAKAEEFVQLVRERRAALITAAVTGRIDVTRRAA